MNLEDLGNLAEFIAAVGGLAHGSGDFGYNGIRVLCCQFVPANEAWLIGPHGGMVARFLFDEDAQPCGGMLGQQWLDTSTDPPILKEWTGKEWAVVPETKDQEDTHGADTD